MAKDFYRLPLSELSKLLHSKWHDDRLLALIILVRQYQKGGASERTAIYDFYMQHIDRVNNWDLVDGSAGQIVGRELYDRPEKLATLKQLAGSSNIWHRRIAMIATFPYIRDGRADEAWVIAELLLHDSHDLIHKAVGWMLREVGKSGNEDLLLAFLDQHAATMPRTALRYAIERLTLPHRKHYMGLAKK